MKVLLFCPQFAPLIGGAERQAERLAKGLIAQGTRVEVWASLPDRASPHNALCASEFLIPVSDQGPLHCAMCCLAELQTLASDAGQRAIERVPREFSMEAVLARHKTTYLASMPADTRSNP